MVDSAGKYFIMIVAQEQLTADLFLRGEHSSSSYSSICNGLGQSENADKDRLT